MESVIILENPVTKAEYIGDAQSCEIHSHGGVPGDAVVIEKIPVTAEQMDTFRLSGARDVIIRYNIISG
jgi:hypothetical protein